MFSGPLTFAYKLHVSMPTRGRPQQALDVLRKYRDLAGCPLTLEVVIDNDDDSWTADTVDTAAGMGVDVCGGFHKSKIEAVNSGLRLREWDVLVLASDDMVPVIEGWGKHVLARMNEHFPYLDGALHFNDGYAAERLITLPVMGRRLYDQFGYVYFPGYQSFFCDNEQSAVLSKLGKVVYLPEVIIEHRHPANRPDVKMDALYSRNAAAWQHDEKLFAERKARDFDMPPTVLSILIATMPRRNYLLQQLLKKLWTQAVKVPFHVEILVDSGPGSTGAKRQRLLERSRGAYVSFVDDDDDISHEYVYEILQAIEKTPDCDCVELHVNVNDSHRAHCSIIYQEWRARHDMFFERCPNHLSPVKRSLALAAGFPDKSFGEDFEYSMRLRPMLKTEAPTSGQALYHYYPGRGA